MRDLPSHDRRKIESRKRSYSPLVLETFPTHRPQQQIIGADDEKEVNIIRIA